MTKPEALEIIKLISSLESWSFAKEGLMLPDFLYEKIAEVMAILEKEVLG